ncbi:MAG: CHAT domain-containing protein [Muribaculaceae bacterium]|nr:CHAT domain-containing protein [Muribaculaceae bacterium]
MSIFDSFRYSFIRILIIVGFLLGAHGICHSMDGSDGVGAGSVQLETIDSLLNLHDQCRQGVIYPDSAIHYSILALNTATEAFGIESEEYSDIFTDYFLSDIARYHEMLATQAYPLLTNTFDCSTPYGWRPFYRLASLLADYNETEKAEELYRTVINRSPSPKGRVLAGMELAKIQQREESSDLEQAYLGFMDDITALQTPDRENVLIEIAIDLASYFLSLDNDDKTLEYIDNGERLKGHVSSHKMLRLLSVKHDYLLRHNHRAAIDCLNEAFDMVSQEDADQADRDWIALALVDRGDYAWNQLVNVEQACGYYVKAFNLLYGNSAYDNKVLGVILHRLVYLLTLSGDMDQAIKLGELYLKAVGSKGISNPMLFLVLDLVEAYLKSGQVFEASRKFDAFKDDLLTFDDTREKALLMESKINIAMDNSADAAKILESLLESARRKDVRMWAIRHLATAYTNLGDPRMDALSDSINYFTKDWIGKQFWFITPSERRNWLKLCQEAVEHQLSLKGNEHAVRNAAELNLFRKSLLYRTDSKIEEVIAQDPRAVVSLNCLDSLRRKRIDAMNRGDGNIVREVNIQIDSLRRDITNDFVERCILQRDLDIDLSQVCAKLGRDAIAIDFISFGSDEDTEFGAFAYAQGKAPKYIRLTPNTEASSMADTSYIWSNLADEIKNYRKVYFCPDGILNTIPIEYIKVVGNDTSSTCPCPELHRVFHLSMINDSQTSGDKLAFIGVADYSSSNILSDSIKTWTTIESPMLELRSIHSNWTENIVTILLDGEANERNFYQLNGRPLTTLHISTHGIFRSHESLEDILKCDTYSGKSIAAHWLSVSDDSLSGIILRQESDNAPETADCITSDGLLTAEEIETMRFPDLRLTVLSACDTGLGEIDSEGVWGLQRAFRIAGTKNLICTLSKVDDYWTAQFMDAFYEQAAKGKSIYDSFHIAQQWLYRELPDNPEIWSSFILIE